MIGMKLTMKVNPQNQEEFLQAMRSLLSGREREGLKTSTLSRRNGDRTRFSLTCEWETQQHLAEYLRAEEFRVLLGAVKILCEESAIRYTPNADDWADLRPGTE